METTIINFIGQNQCPFKYKGINLAAMRRAALLKVAHKINAATGGSNVNVSASASKNDLLIQMIAIGKARTWEAELSDLFDGVVARKESLAKKITKKFKK